MNGEGTSKTVSLNDELLTWKVSNEVVESPVSSRYSSCGESEFDRYCSANSVMGTPSLCGSVGTFQDFNDSDIGSVKSSRFGDVNGLESFSLGGKFDRKFESKSLLGKMDMGNEMETAFSDMSDGGGVVMWKEGVSSKITQSSSSDKSHSISEETMEEKTVNVEVEEGLESRMDVEQNGRKLDEGSDGETSSRLEHSESEGSMFGYGTDNEERNGLPLRGCTDYLNDKKNDSENTLFMTSSVAYGSDDLNDFMQESMGNPRDLFVIDDIQKHDQNEIGSEGVGHTSKSNFVSESIDVSQKQEIVKDVPTYSKTHSLEDMFVIAKQAEDFNRLKIEEVSRAEVGPLMDVLPKKPEHTDSNETIENLTLCHVQSTLTQDVKDHVVEMSNDHEPYLPRSLPNINVEKRENASPILLNISEDLEMASKVSFYHTFQFYLLFYNLFIGKGSDKNSNIDKYK